MVIHRNSSKVPSVILAPASLSYNLLFIRTYKNLGKFSTILTFVLGWIIIKTLDCELLYLNWVKLILKVCFFSLKFVYLRSGKFQTSFDLSLFFRSFIYRTTLVIVNLTMIYEQSGYNVLFWRWTVFIFV